MRHGPNARMIAYSVWRLSQIGLPQRNSQASLSQPTKAKVKATFPKKGSASMFSSLADSIN